MQIVCPKCGHALGLIESAPSGECPGCGLILSKKYLAAQEQKRKAEEATKNWFRGESLKEPDSDPVAPASSAPLSALAAKAMTASCPACGGLVAIGAKACPHCGKQNPAPKPTSRVVLLVAGLLLAGFVVTLATRSPSVSLSSPAGVVSRLEAYGRSLAASTPNGAVRFSSVVSTTEKPLRAYKVVFSTSVRELMSNPNGSTDRTARTENLGRTAVWQAKFCTRELKTIMARDGLDLVSGDLQNISGLTQSMALCIKDN